MKKTYIEPENTVLVFEMEKVVCQSAPYSDTPSDKNEGGGSDALAREVIQAPDAWEEW
jgi:hypothetical protein